MKKRNLSFWFTTKFTIVSVVVLNFMGFSLAIYLY